MITKDEWLIAAKAMGNWPRFMFVAHTIKHGIDNGVVIPDMRNEDILMSPAVAILQHRLGGNVILPRSEVLLRLLDINEAIRDAWDRDNSTVGMLIPYQLEYDTHPDRMAEWMREKARDAE